MTFLHEIDPVIARLGPLTFRWYGLIFAVGVLLNFLYVRWPSARQGSPLRSGKA